MFLIPVLYGTLALTFIFAKQALFYAKPFFLIAVRMLLAGSLLLGYQRFFRPDAFYIKREDLGLFIKTALFHIYIAFSLEFFALQYLSSLKTTLIFSATPFVSAVLAYIILRERLSFKKIIGIFCGTLGLIPVLIAQSTSEVGLAELCSISVPEVALIGAVISAAYAWFIVMDLMKKRYELVLINGFAMTIGGVLSLISSWCIEGFGFHVTAWQPFMFWLFLLILSANFIVYNLYGLLLKRHSIILVSFAGWLCPSFAALYEKIFFNGVISWHYVASLFFIIIGLFIFYNDDLKRRR